MTMGRLEQVGRRRDVRRLLSFVPISSIRNRLVGLLPGVELGPGASIGFGTVIDVESFVAGAGAVIGRFNRISGPITVRIGPGASIGTRNEISCGDWVCDDRFRDEGYQRRFELGADCLITDEHVFDAAGLVSIGDGTWFAGKRSQVWTHGVGIVDRDVHIGPRCYIGSSVLFSPGTGLGPGNVVSLGSVVTRDFRATHDCLIGGAPAAAIKDVGEDFATGRLHPFQLGATD